MFSLTLTHWTRSKAYSAAALFVFLGSLIFYATFIITEELPEGSLHLIVPATSSNADLCKLLLSAAILGYPPAVLINWGATEDKDAYVQHLAKVWTILEYLDELTEAGKGQDLVLIVDGFDVHFQLPPEVIVSRYYEENARANKRIEAQVGADEAKKHGFKQTVIFGHDKLCWPVDSRRPACWVVPEASDPPFAYGPYTDTGADVARARWLNSGTVLGPVDDVRNIFRATLDLIHKDHTTDSDQFYFANIFADQEYARRTVQPGDPFKDVKKEDFDWPVIEAGQRTEYYLGLDYEAVMFQTMAFFREYITWMTFDLGEPTDDGWSVDKPQQQIMTNDWYRNRLLPKDIREARGPFDALLPDKDMPTTKNIISTLGKSEKALTKLSWNDLQLGANVISGNIFPLLHFTGDKSFRDKWWPRLWFVPYGEELLKASIKRKIEEEKEFGRATVSKIEIGGRIWLHGEVVGTDLPEKVDWGVKGGAFGGNGTFLAWEDICGMHETILFDRKVEGTRR